jgi:threonine dehydrogenase-like Zn-dependent dehydrogenase
MKAAVYFAKSDLRIIEVPIGRPNPNEVIVRVKNCGVCGTDLHIFDGSPGSAPVIPPRILGHELSGVVAAIGKNVIDVKEGDNVCVDPNVMCGECFYCRNGQSNFCENHIGIGTSADGAFAEYIKVNKKVVYKIPSSMSFETAAMVEPVSCCLNGIQLLDVHPGETVLIIGSGPIGLIMLQMVRNAGAARIIVSEPEPSKRILAQQLGASVVVDPIELDDMLIEERNISRVVECVGSISTMAEAIKVAGKGATVLLFGLTKPEAELTIKPYEVFRKQLKITSSFINPYTFNHSIDLLNSGRVNVEPLITDRVLLDGILPVFSDPAFRKRGKIMVTV